MCTPESKPPLSSSRKKHPSSTTFGVEPWKRKVDEARGMRPTVQDLRIGNKNATVVDVAKAAGVTDNSPFSFGSVHVLDDLVTEGPGINSWPLGRVQGLTTNADLSTFVIAMNLNFYFTAGKLAGSTLCILGRNQVMDARRELPVVGGSGVFRFARGYAMPRIRWMPRLTTRC